MSTLYFHIPFCKQACHYCDFHFSTVRKSYRPVLDAMFDELEARTAYLKDKKLSSVYFGGGTPSLLEQADLEKLLELTHKQFKVQPGAEITLEANPDDLNKYSLQAFKRAGINRLSIGTQSFFDEDLKMMNRAHNAKDATASIKHAQDAGFENLTIDLIYGMPNSTLGQWQTNVQMALELGIPHVSSYALTIEPKTALASMVQKGNIQVLSDEDTNAQYHELCKMMQEAGLNHYELSNFGKPGFYSSHNSSYWAGASYLGIGPSAHSFDGKTRQWNISNNTKYIQAMVAGETWFEMEELSESDAFNEYLMTGLRTAKGVSLTIIDERFGDHRSDQLIRDALNYLECGRLILDDDRLFIPETEWLISDRIISDLFWVT